MNEVNWQEKFAALKALDRNLSLTMRSPNNWYLQIKAEILRGKVLASPTQSGDNPEMAVGQAWGQYGDGSTIVLNAMASTRREVRWNGFMWEDVQRGE